MAKLTIALDDQQKRWVDNVCRDHGLSIRDVFRRLTKAAMIADWDPLQELDLKDHQSYENEQEFEELPDKERFLFCIRQLYSIGLATEKAKVTVAEVKEWLKDSVFHQRVLFARDLFLEETEKALKDVGEGMKSGNATALASFLAANHPSYGITKRKSFDQVCGDLIDSIAYHAEKEFSRFEGGREATKRFVEKVVEDTKFYRNELPE